MFGGNDAFVGEIGDRLSNFEEAEVGTSRQTMSFDRMREYAASSVFKFEVLADMFACEFGIGAATGLAGAGGLPVASRLDTPVNVFAGFAG